MFGCEHKWQTGDLGDFKKEGRKQGGEKKKNIPDF